MCKCILKDVLLLLYAIPVRESLPFYNRPIPYHCCPCSDAVIVVIADNVPSCRLCLCYCCVVASIITDDRW